jgi:regulator of protease activity HflC (stomatin/prohibitin superfamily)
MASKLEPRGIILEDFQLREVRLETTLQDAVTAKTAAQQEAERQQFELSIAQQQAEITRVQAIATADAQQILACGGYVDTVTNPDGTTVDVVVPRPISDCTQAQLTPQYLQWTYIQALQALVDSPNNSTIILPFDENLTPLLNIPGGSPSTPEMTPTTVPPETTTTAAP